MSYFAGAAVRGADGWTAAELDLAGAVDLDDVAERMRDVDPDADVSLLFVEADDIYLTILRLDEGENLRVFSCDSAFADESRLGALLVGDLQPSVLDADGASGSSSSSSEDSDDSDESDDDEEDEEPADPDADPIGDADLLTDFGISPQRLLALCAHEGMMPADVTAEVCQIIGCGDEVEELREA